MLITLPDFIEQEFILYTQPLSYFCLRYISSFVLLIIKCQISNTKGVLQSKYHCGGVPYQLYIINLLIYFSNIHTQLFSNLEVLFI